LNRSPRGSLLCLTQVTQLRRLMSIRRFNVPLSLVVDPDTRSVSDSDLARALGAGDAWAQAETWNRFAPMVFGIAVRALGSESEAEDVVQEVFYRMLAKATSLRSPESLRSFVVSFAIRILKWELRRKRTRSWLSFERPAMLADVASEELDFESRDLVRRFYAFLSRQAPRERLVLSLRYLESMTVEEIAKVMEISESTVKRSLECGRRELSHWIETDLGPLGLLDGRRELNET
jgi:RNA polymerase sigma-70 factor, ECF subfamily